MIKANANVTHKGFNAKAYNTSNKANKANNKAKQVNNNNNNNILANALIDYVACIDSVSNICIKYNITRQAFYKYKSKLANFYDVDYDVKHKQSKKALYDMLMLLKHIDSFAKSNNTLLDYAGKAFYNNIQDLLNTKRHDKLSNNIDKLSKNDVFSDVLSTDNANNDLQDNNAILQASNDLIHANNDIMLHSGDLIVEDNTLDTELILNDTFASIANDNHANDDVLFNDDVLCSDDVSRDNAANNNTNKPYNSNDIIIDF